MYERAIVEGVLPRLRAANVPALPRGVSKYGSMEPLVSLVIPTSNRRLSLARLLESLIEQTHSNARFEVLVVDDGSTDGTLEYLRSLVVPYPLRVLPQPHRGPAAARNLGAQQSQAALIVFIDDDVVPSPGLIAEHAATHQAIPDAVVVGPMLPPRDWPRPVWVRWEEQKLRRQYDAMLSGRYPCTPRQFYTGNSSLTRARFFEAGGFDPGFKRAEDVELGYRLSRRGARFVFNPRAVVLHYPSRSFAAWCRTPYQYGRNDVRMERDKGHVALQVATREFQTRHPLNCLMTRLCVGRQTLLKAAVCALRSVVHIAGHVRSERTAQLALSGIFNLLYWQGVCDELGGPEPLGRSLAAGASAAE
jgi:GT2 family glycosyltransferase